MPVKEGAIIRGKQVFRSGKNWVLFKYEKEGWRAEITCLVLQSSDGKEQEELAPDPSPEPPAESSGVTERRLSKRTSRKKLNQRALSVSAFTGVFIWSEALLGAQANGDPLLLQSSNQGLRLGLKLGIPLSYAVDLGLEMGGVFGMGEIYEKSSSPSTAYRASGSHLGAMVVPSLNWANPDGSWMLGFGAPVYLRRSHWPDPETGIALPASAGLRSGFTLHTTLSSGSWSLMPQVGVLGSTSHWVFLLDLGVRL